MSADPAPSSRAAHFDHDHPRGRRPRRPPPDWGGDDLFDHVPRRRFARAAEAGADAPTRRPWANGGGALDASAPTGSLTSAVEPPPRSGAFAEPAIEGGRRTVTITGRPGEVLVARGDRAPRTVRQRVGARPDRIAALACALGVLLVCLALLT